MQVRGAKPAPKSSAPARSAPKPPAKKAPAARASAAPKDRVTLSGQQPAAKASGQAGPNLQALQSNFPYQPQGFKDHYGANFWQAGQAPGGPESGAQANRQINQDYSVLSKTADEYMRGGTNAPTLNNFFEFAEQASTSVGEQIDNIENLQQAAQGSATGAVKAGRGMLGAQPLEQARRVHGATMQDQANQVVGQNPGDNLLTQGSKVAGGTVGQMWGELDTTRDALVNGNTAIHRQLGSAADTFFTGESQGGKGLESLKKQGIFPGSEKDPDGLITRAFGSMQKVRDLSQKWEQAGTQEEKDKIQAQRLAAAKDSTFSFMMHEQGHILQNGAIFEDQTMRRNLKAITPTMSFSDTNGKQGQLGEGQDYSNFKQRLGLQEVGKDTPGAYPLTRDGQTRHYQPDPSQKGSIVDYFSSNMGADKARPMIDAGPRDLQAPPATQSGRGLMQLAEGVDQRDFSTMTAGTIRGAGGLAADGTQWVGKQADEGGTSLALDGIRQARRGGFVNSTVGGAKVAGGVALRETGRLAQATGELGGKAVDWTADAADSTINWTANTAKSAGNWTAQKARSANRRLRWMLGLD